LLIVLFFLSDNYRREKSLLTEEIVQLKKMREVADRDIANKDSEIVSLRQEMERIAAELRHERHSSNLLQAQVGISCCEFY